MSPPEHSAFLGGENSDTLLGAREDVGRERSGEDEAAAKGTHQVDDSVAAGDITAHVAVRLAQGPGEDVHLWGRVQDAKGVENENEEGVGSNR